MGSKTIDDIISNPEKISPGTRSPLQRAALFAKRVRASMPYHHQGETVQFKKLKGKPVEYVDKECKIRVMRCVEVKGLSQIRVEDFIEGTKTGKKIVHWVHVSQIVGAFARKGSGTNAQGQSERLEVVF